MTRVIEMTDDHWWVGGNFTGKFMRDAVSCNVCLIRKGDALIQVDSSFGPEMRQRILGAIRPLEKTLKRYRLVITQGHFDHVANNDMIKEINIPDKSILVHENDVPGTVDSYTDTLKDMTEASRYCDLVTDSHFPMAGLVSKLVPKSKVPGLFAKILKRGHFSEAHPAGEFIEPLRAEDLEVLSLGPGLDLKGFWVEGVFVISTLAHSKGHVCIYDPEVKMLFTGDDTVEINPAYFYSSTNALIHYMRLFRRMCDEGHIELACDNHHANYFSTFLRKISNNDADGVLGPILDRDFFRGKDECSGFLKFFDDYYTAMRDRIIETHRKVGTATVETIYRELIKVDDPYLRIKKSLHLPMIPSRLRQAVAQVLVEQGCEQVKTEKEIAFRPVDETSDKPMRENP